MKMFKYFIKIFLLVFCLSIIIFESSYAKDKVVFTIEDFFIQIMETHPVARQAALFSDEAKQELRVARGLLDPTINSRLYRKELDGKNYFTLWDNTLRIPVWYGADIKAGFERNSGFNVNGENFTPNTGLTYMGISVPLGQGLIIDHRRATIRQAELLGDLAEAERISLINKLLLQAAKDYWDWLYTYNKLQLHEEGLELAQFRMDAVKIRAAEGDLSNIDTVEAKMELQNRRVLLSQSRVEYQNASLMISNYLWAADGTPLEITDEIIPASAVSDDVVIHPDTLENMIVEARNNHPELLKIKIKQSQHDIERRFLSDRLKPRLNLEYNFIQQGFPVNVSEMNNTFFTNNYKFGLNFSFPLFLRIERGKLQLNKLKITDLNLTMQQSGREISNQIQAFYNDLLNLNEQVQLQEEMVVNSRILRNGEQALFENGESSLFLINVREMNLINNQVKLFELQTKYAQTKMMVQWAAGNIEI
jgi:outer membrane protein TolC